MNNESVAKRYAQPLYELANEQNIVAEVSEQLQVIADVFKMDKELVEFFGHPKVSKEHKKAVIAEMVSSFSTIVTNTVNLLVDRHREDVIPLLSESFTKIRNEAQGIVSAKVYTARPISQGEVASLSETFSKKVGGNKFEIESIVDPSILGGVKLQIGNVIYDGSLQRKLVKLERQLVANRM